MRAVKKVQSKMRENISRIFCKKKAAKYIKLAVLLV